MCVLSARERQGSCVVAFECLAGVLGSGALSFCGLQFGVLVGLSGFLFFFFGSLVSDS